MVQGNSLISHWKAHSLFRLRKIYTIFYIKKRLKDHRKAQRVAHAGSFKGIILKRSVDTTAVQSPVCNHDKPRPVIQFLHDKPL